MRFARITQALRDGSGMAGPPTLNSRCPFGSGISSLNLLGGGGSLTAEGIQESRNPMKIVCLPANVGLERDSRGISDLDEITADARLAMTRRARASAGDIFAE